MSLLRIAAAGTLLVCLASGASAQAILGNGNIPSPVRGQPKLPGGRQAEPPALPGAASKPGEAGDQHVALDLPPTEALFDAINRGNIALARDAIQRGADLSGRNVLGMTPLDLSIDLSRNDITFLLLSMRSQASVSNPPPGMAPADGAPVTKPGKATRAAAAKPARPRTVPAVAAAQTAGQAAVAPPARYAGSTGAASPQAGFLGFGSTAQQ